MQNCHPLEVTLDLRAHIHAKRRRQIRQLESVHEINNYCDYTARKRVRFEK